MPRPKTEEEIRRLKERGVFDAGAAYLRLGLVPKKRHKFWDGWVPPEDGAGRPKTEEEIRRLKERGVFDAGILYLRLGSVPEKKHKFWDGYVPPEDR